MLNQALRVCREAALPNNVARVCAELGGAAADVADTNEADRWYAECERIARELGNDTMLSLAWLGYGTVARLRREPTIARRWFTQALRITSGAGMTSQAVAARTGLAATHLDAFELDEAGATLAQAWEEAAQISDAGARAAILEQQARLALARGEHAQRAALLAEADTLRQSASRPRTAIELRDAQAPETSPVGSSAPGRPTLDR